MYQMKRFIDIERSSLSVFLLHRIGLCSVSYMAYEHSIYLFCIMIKELPIFCSIVIIIQDFKTVTFNLSLVFKPTFSVVF